MWVGWRHLWCSSTVWLLSSQICKYLHNVCLCTSSYMCSFISILSDLHSAKNYSIPWARCTCTLTRHRSPWGNKRTSMHESVPSICANCYDVFWFCSTVRVWRGPKQSDVLNAHKPAVWALDSLFDFDGTRRILSGTCTLAHGVANCSHHCLG